MTRLVTLDLSDYRDTYILHDTDLKTLARNLTGLRELVLDGVNISDEVPEFFGGFLRVVRKISEKDSPDSISS